MQRDCADFDSILKKYERAKLNTYRVLELVGDDYTFKKYNADTNDKGYTEMLNCGTLLVFHSEKVENDKYVYHLTHSNFCRKRICPMCQFRKSEKAFAEMLKVVEELEGQGYRFLHLVLTIPNCKDGEELVSGIKCLYKGFGKFYGCREVKKAFRGCLRCLEVSYNYDNDTFHPHLHCLIAVKKSYFNDSKVYLSYDRIREIWTNSIIKTGLLEQGYDGLLQVYIRAMKEGDRKGVAEVTKYCMKPLELADSERTLHRDMQNINVLLTLWHTLKGTRFVQKYGVIKEVYNALFKDNEADETLTDNIDVANMKKSTYFWDNSDLMYKGGANA